MIGSKDYIQYYINKSNDAEGNIILGVDTFDL
jgi:hypothetical protein